MPSVSKKSRQRWPSKSVQRFSGRTPMEPSGGNEIGFVTKPRKQTKPKATQRVKPKNVVGRKPRKNLYASGRRFEYRVRNWLRDCFNAVVIRSAGSKTPIDLIALWQGRIEFIQCKANGVFSTQERAELCGLADMVGADAILAKKDKDGTIAYERLRACTQDPQKGTSYAK